VETPVIEGAAPTATTRPGHALVKALARAFQCPRLLDEGHYASISEIAAGECVERGDVGRLLQLALLARSVVDAILDGH
jgi:hypothetical protein